MGKPFSVGAQSKGSPANRETPKPAVQEAETARKAEGKKTLVEAAAEAMAPDYEVGSAAAKRMDPEQSGDGARPTHAPRLPWPPAQPVAHKPFKV
jgi:hypothetical protein